MNKNANIRCDECSHREVCSYTSYMEKHQQRLIEVMESNTEDFAEFRSGIFTLPMIGCKFFSLNKIESTNITTLPYYPNGTCSGVLELSNETKTDITSNCNTNENVPCGELSITGKSFSVNM